MSAHGPLTVLSYIWNHPSNRGRRGRALLRAVAWQIYKRAAGGVWDVRLVGNRIIRCYPDNTSASSVLYAGLFDFDAMHFLLRYLRPTDDFLDVGANIGVYTILASSVVSAGTLHAFEPSSIARRRLQENVQLNGLTNVRIHPLAAAEQAGSLQLTRDRDATNYVVVEQSLERVERVVGQAIQDLVGGVAFALGKMDVEGYELPALKGAARMLEAHSPPIWLLEVSELSAKYGYPQEELVRFLSGYGYRPARYRAEENVLRWDEECWRHQQNVLFVAEPHFQRVVALLHES